MTFADGSAEEFDGIVFGTGFDLNLPFLSDEIRAVARPRCGAPGRRPHTFHPDLPGSRSWACGTSRAGTSCRWNCRPGGSPTRGAAHRGEPRRPTSASAIDAYRSRRGMSQKTRMNLAALTFARAAGVEPHLENWPELRRALLFGPLAPSCFRLEGPDALPDAPARFARDAAAFGAITSNELTERERNYWSLVEGNQ